MKSFFACIHLVCKKAMLVGITGFFLHSYLMAVDYQLPSHDEIKKEVNFLLELNRLKNSNATVWQNFKDMVSQMASCVEITRENAPSIYKLIEAAAAAIGVEIKSKIYLDISTPNFFVSGINFNGYGKNGILLTSGMSVSETYLYIGSKFLCELTPAETKAFLEYEFIFMKHEFFKKRDSKVKDLLKLEGYLLGSGISLLYLESLFLKKNPQYIKSKIAIGAIGPILAAYLILSGAYLLYKSILTFIQITEMKKKVEQYAYLGVTSREDFFSGSKKLAAMIMIEQLKNDPSKIDKKFFYMIERDMYDTIIKYIDNGEIQVITQ